MTLYTVILGATAPNPDGNEAAVLRAIDTFTREHRYGPAWSDLASLTGLSHSKVMTSIQNLAATGHVLRDPRVARSLRVATDDERNAVRVQAWESVLSSLPSTELRALRDALARVTGGGNAPIRLAASSDR